MPTSPDFEIPNLQLGKISTNGDWISPIADDILSWFFLLLFIVYLDYDGKDLDVDDIGW